MTRKEAINHIKYALIENKYPLPKELGIEALQIAIKALEQEPCEDCVSRKELKKWLDMNFSFGGALRKLELFERLDKELPTVTPTKSEKVETEEIKRVTLTPFEIRMMQMALYHQWVNMTDDNGEAVNCEQKSANCVFNLLNRFEKLRAEVEEEGER